MPDTTTDDGEQDTRTIDLTPTIYGEAYGEANAGINNADLHDDVRNSEEWRHAQPRVIQNTTDRLVRFVLFRRVIEQLVERDQYNVTQEDINELHNELIDNDTSDGADQRVLDALNDEDEEE